MKQEINLLTGEQMLARLRLAYSEIAILRDRIAVNNRLERERANGNRPVEIVGDKLTRILEVLRTR
jgi:hypothetical protein